MGIFLIYILKSAVCLSLFYLFYRLLLSKETFHRFNRIALLGILFLSLLIPFIEVTTAHQTELSQTVLTVEQLLMMAEAMDPAEVSVAQPEELSISWVQVLLLFYLVGIIFFACRNLYSLSRLLLLIKSGKRERLKGGVRLIVLEREVAPFSWMRYIVISRKDLEEDGREILIHEMAHIQNRHSIDLLVADICIFFQWFNPGIWLLKQELQNIHEYEADETVINEGIDAKDYQLLLIKKAVGTRLYSMANSFNHSKLKKRITMMLKEKSSPWARLKYLYVLPVAAIAVTAFARPEVSETVEEISAVKVNDLTAIVETKVAESSGQLLPVQSVPKDSVNRKSKVAVQQMDELVVVGYASKDSVKDREPVFNVVEQMPSFPGGMEALMQYLAKNMRYPVEAQKNKVQGRVVVGFIVSKDGDIKKAHILRGVDPELDAEAIRVIESMPRWMPGMQRGKAVAVSYTLPVMFRLTEDALGLKLVEASGSTAGELDKGVTFSYAEGKQPLCIVNGKEVDWAVMRALNPDRIKSITVLKDKAILEEKYGEKGQNGVLLITLKGYTE